jgi:anaerobic sulfite reductase subunit C
MKNKKINLDLNELRTGGILKQLQKDYFILRTRIPGGYLKADMLPRFSKIAKKYAKGYVHLSTRQAIEIPWIHIRHLEPLINDLKKLGIFRGACGPRSRNIVACPGSSVCRFGFTNVENLAAKFDKEFFGLDVPKKFKIALTGCPNSCAKPQENDVGFMAMAEPFCDLTKCTSCALCAKVCEKVCSRGGREPAIIMDENKKPVYRREYCFFEGDCVRVCPATSWKVKRTGYAVFVGGKVGRFPMFGYKIKEFAIEEEIYEITKKAIKLYNQIAEPGERFGDAYDRDKN